MTSPPQARKKSSKVLPFPNNLYAQCRLECGAAPRLREQDEPPPERLLQAIWLHQRLQRDQLVSLDGEALQVLHPGFISREGGPDFRRAIIRFGNAPPLSGDVEVDVHAGGWIAHGHDRNPVFRGVILHVIWEGDRPARGAPPTLVLRGNLDATLAELGLWLDSEPGPVMPGNLRGRCCPALESLSPEEKSRLFTEAAEVRFRSKAEQLQARARQAGWEQSLWEGLFRALGYKHNTWPMHRLAEQRPRWFAHGMSPIELQARLLGIGGLLPSELTRSCGGADRYLRRVWDFWWRDREEFEECILPASLWRFHGLRPANNPQRRLALATHWLASRNFVPRPRALVHRPSPGSQGTWRRCWKRSRSARDDFWSWHWTLRSARMARPQPLLGPARATDLAVNVILPVGLGARCGRQESWTLQDVLERPFRPGLRPRTTRACGSPGQRLLGDAPRRLMRRAAEQQGCIQIVRDFCDHSDAVCTRCRFPRLVESRFDD